jgi:hypothetical protein
MQGSSPAGVGGAASSLPGSSRLATRIRPLNRMLYLNCGLMMVIVVRFDIFFLLERFKFV